MELASQLRNSGRAEAVLVRKVERSLAPADGALPASHHFEREQEVKELFGFERCF